MPLGLVPFLVPGWPSREAFAQTVAALARVGCAGWELAMPAGGWSATTSAPIAAALATTPVGFDEAADTLAGLRPGIAVVYPPSLSAWGREGLLGRLAGRCDHIMLDTPTADTGGWIEACARHGLGWIEVADAAADAPAIARRADALPASGAIYLTAAPTTGGFPRSFDALAQAVAAIRRRRADLVVTTGFGISTPKQVEQLAAIDGLDAVAIGTALLRSLGHGADAAANYFAALGKTSRRADALS